VEGHHSAKYHDSTFRPQAEVVTPPETRSLPAHARVVGGWSLGGNFIDLTPAVALPDALLAARHRAPSGAVAIVDSDDDGRI
jgi:hypothetical protein